MGWLVTSVSLRHHGWQQSRPGGGRSAENKPIPNVNVAEITMTSTEVLEHVEESTTDDAPELFHYVRKAKIAESAVLGTGWSRCAGRPSR